MGKNPAFLFYPGDWIQDTRTLSVLAKGGWIDILCAMWRSAAKGELTLSIMSWARLMNANLEQAIAIINELVEMKICDYIVTADVTFPLHVTDRNKNVTLINRRMKQEENQRKSTRYRVQNFRKRKCNTNVTPPSSVTVTDSVTKKKHIPDLKHFEFLWKKYPNKDGKKDAQRHYAATVKTVNDKGKIEQALDNYIRHLSTNLWKPAKNGSTWFNNWQDWVIWIEPPKPKEEKYDPHKITKEDLGL